jgi:hypothetical protein
MKQEYPVDELMADATERGKPLATEPPLSIRPLSIELVCPPKDSRSQVMNVQDWTFASRHA